MGPRRRIRHQPAPVVWAALLLACLVGGRYFRPLQQPEPQFFESGRLHRVERVIDGDTLLIAGGHRVRLIGVDTPETKHPDRPVDPLGIKAAQFTREHVEGQQVTLRFDRERRDRYHRILAYVFVGDWFLNEELIRAGHSRAETRFPFSQAMKRQFEKAEEAARESRRGMWADAGEL